MSAICGIFNLNGKPVARETVNAMLKPMDFRGPDGKGVWSEGAIGFGHLASHITPESLHETLPFTDPLSGLSITADARIDNRGELFDALGVSHTIRKETADSMLILKAYEKWGADCLSRLLGDFAFAIWDNKERELFCARDHAGCRPFYYHKSGRFFAFATAVRGILTLDSIPCKLNERRIARYLGFINLVGEATFYQSVSRLVPGHFMIVKKDSFTIRRYWSMEDAPDVRYKSDNDYIDAFREIFFEAVRCRLRSIHPIGLKMSGGLDSGSVGCVAARLLRERGENLLTYSMIPVKEEYCFFDPKRTIADETPFIETIKKQEDNIIGHYIKGENTHALTGLKNDFLRFDRPVAPITCRDVSINMHKTAQSHNVRVILTGANGNGTISWNGKGYLGKLARQGKWVSLAKAVTDKCSVYHLGVLSTLKHEVIKLNIPDILWRIIQNRKFEAGDWRQNLFINPDFASRINIKEIMMANNSWPIGRSFPDTKKNRYKMINPEKREINVILTEFAACYNMESRNPTIDKRVFEFCLGIPDEQYIRNGKSRMLIRRAMKGIVPEKVLCNTKIGRQGIDYYPRLKKNWHELEESLNEMKISETVCHYLNLPKMLQVADFYKKKQNGEPGYDLTTLIQAIIMGQFLLQWEREHSPESMKRISLKGEETRIETGGPSVDA